MEVIGMIRCLLYTFSVVVRVVVNAVVEGGTAWW